MALSLTKKYPWFDGNVILIVLIIKAVVLIFAAVAYQIVKEQPVTAEGSVLEIWKRWDAVHYLKIAETGYTAVGDDRFLIVFFPLYPLLVRSFSYITGNYLVAAFLVTTIASVAVGLLFRQLVKLDHPEKTARLAVLFLFVFPTSYFLHIPYTESLFLALVIGSFLAARKRFWLTASILGGLACMTRVNGLILVFALAFELWDEYRETREFNRAWLFLGLIPAGFGAYLILNYLITGNPITFLEYQREHWHRYFRVPWEGLYESCKRMFNPKIVHAQLYGVQEMLFVVIGFAATVVGWSRLRNSYRAWMVANWLMFVSTSFVLSVPRYTLTLFPLFILVAMAAKRSWTFQVLFVCWSILFLGLFSMQFARGHWAF
ncbi:MAG TPA: mannosyltransferase family protein [Pyrinomonadaceae bacterium]|nr:mannosyltransferase family protein [Pyrinomonadaceae bacterium]